MKSKIVTEKTLTTITGKEYKTVDGKYTGKQLWQVEIKVNCLENNFSTRGYASTNAIAYVDRDDLDKAGLMPTKIEYTEAEKEDELRDLFIKLLAEVGVYPEP